MSPPGLDSPTKARFMKKTNPTFFCYKNMGKGIFRQGSMRAHKNLIERKYVTLGIMLIKPFELQTNQKKKLFLHLKYLRYM